MNIYNVSEINNYIGKIFKTDFLLTDIKIKGEITDFKHHHSGHMYFTLKDDFSRIRCVMFKSHNIKNEIDLKDGIEIVARGNIGVYTRNGQYQLYVEEIIDSSKGDIYKKFEELKKKLKKEGLFKEEYKKKLPDSKKIKKVGVLTSPTGAAVRDIINVIKRRSPGTDIVIYPTKVQGIEALKGILEGLDYLENREDIDVIILGRGGGSYEDLSVFNEEELARKIFDITTPIVTAIGHEIDFTIADFVADIRASTPSSAAELVVVNRKNEMENLNTLYDKVFNKFKNKLDNMGSNLKSLEKDLNFFNPIDKFKLEKVELDKKFDKGLSIIENKLKLEKEKVNSFSELLRALNPYKKIKEGYCIVEDVNNIKITSIKDVNIGDRAFLFLKDGFLEIEVKSIKGEVSNEKN